jgi:hypothetical protein
MSTATGIFKVNNEDASSQGQTRQPKAEAGRGRSSISTQDCAIVDH